MPFMEQQSTQITTCMNLNPLKQVVRNVEPYYDSQGQYEQFGHGMRIEWSKLDMGQR